MNKSTIESLMQGYEAGMNDRFATIPKSRAQMLRRAMKARRFMKWVHDPGGTRGDIEDGK